ncbi:MAG: hypothetical protein GVY19_12025 [Bacteroidetes bacterium]|jgi:hypothetical protein|nr:hypothetical protein [Bacteroidota bacterium]
MRNIKLSIIIFCLIPVLFIACESDDNTSPSTTVSDIYIVNYGSFSGSKTTISSYDEENDTIYHDIYKNINNVGIGSNVQSMSIHNNMAYMMSNNGDKIDIANSSNLEASVSPIAAEITKPRYFAATNNTAYVSCWGDVVDWAVYANSYIARINLSSNEVSKKITLPGGPEGVIIRNNKLFAGSTAKNQISVVNLDNDSISYIDVPALPKHFETDSEGNLWVSLVSEFSVSFDSTKLGVIMLNPESNTTSNFINIQGIGSNGYLATSPDKKNLYVMGNESWPGTASFITAIDLTTNMLASEPLIEGENYYGMGCHPENGDIYVLISPGTDVNGSLEVYNNQGELLDTQQTGIAPQNVVFKQ